MSKREAGFTNQKEIRKAHKKIKNKGLAIGTAALAVLCLAYMGMGWYLDQAEEKRERQAQAQIQYMTDIEEVTRISYNYNGEELSFTKSDGIWSYDQDPDFPVVQSKARDFYSRILTLPLVLPSPPITRDYISNSNLLYDFPIKIPGFS